MDGRAVHRLGQHYWASTQHLSSMPHSAYSSPNTTNCPPSCTVGPNGLSSNSSSPQPHTVHALMHAPSNIGWRSSAASPNSSSPHPRAAHAVMHAPGAGGSLLAGHDWAERGSSCPKTPAPPQRALRACFCFFALCALRLQRRSAGPARLNGSFERAVSGQIELIARS
jgi:hypothetical protein